MFGLFAMFGRSRELRQFDDELRSAGLHPSLVPEPVKLTALTLLKEFGPATRAAYASASQLLAYCILGYQDFDDVNHSGLARDVEGRMAAALETGDDLDARLILLALHSAVIDPDVVQRFGLEVDQDRD